MDVRPIKTEDDLTWALAQVEQYFVTVPAPDTAEANRFDVLTDLIEMYESRYHPINKADPVEAISYFMQETGKTNADLSLVLGSKSRASEVMTKKRGLSLDMIRKLVTTWHIPAEVLLTPYHIER